MDIEDFVMMFIGVAVGIVILGIALGQVYAPTQPTTGGPVSNSTAIAGLTSTGNQNHSVLLVNPDVNATATVTLTFARNRTDEIVLRDRAGTLLRNVSGASPQTFGVSSALFVNGQTFFNYTTNASTSATNITSISVTYQVLPDNQTQGWAGAVNILWMLALAIVLIAAMIIAIMKMF